MSFSFEQAPTIRMGEVKAFLPDVMYVACKKNYTIEAKDLEEFKAYRLKTIGDKPFFTILDMTKGLVSASRDAKAWAATNNKSSAKRRHDVFIVSSWLTKFKVNLYQFLFKPKTKTKVVRSLEEAQEFIAEFKKKNPI